MQFGVLGSGSWATALTKILTDNKHPVNWWIRNGDAIRHLTGRHHNPHYLSSVYFDTSLLRMDASIQKVVEASDCLVLAMPSAYIHDACKGLDKETFKGRKIISAVKGILPENNLLANDYFKINFGLALKDYFTVMGPCHAEEVAAEKLSYLTFSGTDEVATEAIARCFKTDYLNVVVNQDVLGVQYAAILKNIYALCAGIAHGLDYGDNFLSVLIANSADEMAGFLRKVGIRHIEVGVHEEEPISHKKSANYAASVYLGDLLVTCYSLYSRNRTFGNMIGKGYSVKSAQLEMNMVAEGYNASKCMFLINQQVRASIPIVETVYQILWNGLPARQGFQQIEEILV
ncbi:MAG: NAD(P)-binding domain-containing protein [Williamsia sp.]|nr:NAD(P)-binding domain-containing protein [Williamsia sp.]